MRWRFWRRRTNCLIMEGWWFASIQSTWINFASCCVCQNDFKTSGHLATVKSKLLTTARSWNLMILLCISCIGILLYLSPDLPQCQYVIRYLSTCAHKRLWWSWSMWLATWQVTQTSMFLWSGSVSILVCFETMNAKSPFWKYSVMRIGLQTATPDVRCLAAPFSTAVAWCTHHQGPRRLCHYPVQSRKHMLLFQLSWMPSSLGPFCVGYSKFESSCISTWILQLEGEFSHVGVLVVWAISAEGYSGSRILWLRKCCKWKQFWEPWIQPTFQRKDF